MCQTNWWKKIDCFVVYVFVISSQKYWSQVYILQILKKQPFDRKLIFFSYEERYTLLIWKSKKKYMSQYYFFLYSIYRKPNIQNDFPKTTNMKWICFFLNKQWSEINWFFKNREIKKVKPPVGFEPATPGFWGYGTPTQRKLTKTL